MNKLTVLIAEDNDWHRTHLARLLRARGYDVVLACNAAELTAAAKRCAPDAIFADLFLPGMSALTLAQNMAGSSCSVPLVVLVSNSTESSIAQQSISNVTTLARPFDERALAQALAVLRCNRPAVTIRLSCSVCLAAD